MDDKAFSKFLENVDKVVRTWPLWKQTLLSDMSKREEPREPVDNFKQVADHLRSENRVLQQTNVSLREQVDALNRLYHKHGETILRQEGEINGLREVNEALISQLDGLRRAYDKTGEALLRHATEAESMRQRRCELEQKFEMAIAYQDELLKGKQELLEQLDAIARIANGEVEE